jgi:hypothetical protein
MKWFSSGWLPFNHAHTHAVDAKGISSSEIVCVLCKQCVFFHFLFITVKFDFEMSLKCFSIDGAESDKEENFQKSHVSALSWTRDDDKIKNSFHTACMRQPSEQQKNSNNVVVMRKSCFHKSIFYPWTSSSLAPMPSFFLTLARSLALWKNWISA